MKSCRIPGCSGEVSRWSALCTTHKTRQRRHGHPLQEGITKAHLGPYLAQVRARKARNTESPLWKQLEARWATLVDHCRASSVAGQSVPMNKYERQAYEDLVNFAGQVDPAEVVEIALALFLMQDQHPRRFRSDDAFRHQLARRVRALAEVNVGSFFDHESGKVHRVYRDLPARTTLLIGAMLERTFGQAGLLLAKKEREDAEKAQSDAQALRAAIDALE